MAAGYVRAFPCGAEPDTSTVNFDPGQTAANLAIVRLPADGRVCFTSFVPTDLVVDVSGWYAPGTGGSGYTPVEPERVLDTRQTQPLGAGQELRFSLAGQSGFPADATAVAAQRDRHQHDRRRLRAGLSVRGGAATSPT